MCTDVLDQFLGAAPGSDVTAGASGYVPGPGDFTAGASGYVPGPGFGDLSSGAGQAASDYAVGPMYSAIPSGGAGGGGGVSLGDVTNAIKPYVGPALSAGSMLYGANQQSKMGQGLAKAQDQSYDKYLNALNPPEATKQAMFNKVNSQILSSSPIMMRKISNELASRGVRGQGTAAPIAGAQRGVTGAQRNAYLDIYGRYNAPQALPPVNYSPSTGNLMGKNVSDIGTLMLMKQMFG